MPTQYSNNIQNNMSSELDNRRRQPSTPPLSIRESMMSRVFAETPRRMAKRPRVPQPLQLDPLTPPPTIEREIFHSPFLIKGLENFDSPHMISPGTPTSLKNAIKSYIKEDCCICEEPLTTKLSTEKVLELDCEHKCHNDCYMILLNKDDFADLPECSLCGVKTRPVDEAVLEELFSQTLMNQDAIGNDKHSNDTFQLEPPVSVYSTALQTDVLPRVSIPGCKSAIAEAPAPFTPVNQITNNLNSAGFDPSPGMKRPPASSLSSRSSLKSACRVSMSDHSPRCSVDDLIKPHVTIINEFSKHSVNDSASTYKISQLVNIFTNELDPEEVTTDDLELKEKINDKVISVLTDSIDDFKGVDFTRLPALTMFDHFEISLDGESWENVMALIFSSILIIVNEDLDNVIGTVLLEEHFTNSVVQEDGNLSLYFSTATLPELQIKSYSGAVIARWDDFFTYKFRQGKKVSLMQMSINSWGLVYEGNSDMNIQIPGDIIKLSALTERGLELPLNLMRLILPQPKRLPVSVIASVALFNTTQLSNEDYLMNIKQSLHLIRDELEPQDKLGLVLLGRSGSRVLNPKESTFFGMISGEWEGWDDIISELDCYKSRRSGNLGCLVKSLKKLSITVPELCEVKNVKKLVMVRCANSSGPIEPGFQWILDQGFSIHDHLISETYDDITESLISDQWGSYVGTQYHFSRHANFSDFHKRISHMMTKFKRAYINVLDLSFDLNKDSCVSLAQVESSGKMVSVEDQHHWSSSLLALGDGYYHNTAFEIVIDVQKLCNEQGFKKNEFQEIPVMKYSYEYQGNKVTKAFNVKLCVKSRVSEITPEAFITMENTQDKGDSTYLDIPMLPPLSSFKDSLYVKKQIELMVIQTLSKHDISIHELISLIFGLIRGCSTDYVEFFKYSRFNRHKNFTFYIDELVKKLSDARDETSNKDLMYKLMMTEDI